MFQSTSINKDLATYWLRLPFLICLFSAVCSLFIWNGIAIGQDDYDDEEDEAPLFMPGLAAEYISSNGQSFERLDEVVSMNWGQGVPDLRIPAGKFSTRWSGHLQVWTTGEYRFRIYLAGKASLKIAGQVVLEGEQSEPSWLESEPIEVEWGEPAIELTYEKTTEESQISFYWQGPDFDWEPVSTHSLMHETDHPPDNRFLRGRFLARALRCSACHDLGDQQRISAPALNRLQGAISADWIVDWLMEKPSETPPTKEEDLVRRMPHFALTSTDAKAIAAALLASDKNTSTIEPTKGKVEDGRKLFLSVGCTACHRVGELGESGLFGGGDLSSIATKRPATFFSQWLKDPASLNRDHRMPVFTLNEAEQSNLAAYLATLGDEKTTSEFKIEGEHQIARGKKLIQELRCANCHRLAKHLAKTSAQSIPINSKTVDWNHSCAGTPHQGQPQYGLATEQQAALKTYLAELPGELDLTQLKPDGKFLMQERNCLGCHSRGSVKGIEKQIQSIAAAEHSLERKMANIKPPALDSIGDKLHDQVLLDAITTQRKARRDWLLVRMPKFQFAEGEAEAIAEALIQEDRIPAPPTEQALTVEQLALQSAGSRLVTTDGFGCTSCHQIGEVKPTHVAGGVHGPNLSQIGKDVRYRWFLRWVLNPARISPRMEMPAVKTPIRGVLDGKLNHQHAAVWAVLNQEGFQPPKPNPVRVIRQRNEAGVDTPPIVVIDNLEVAKHSFVKPLLVALSNRHNILFDLENYRLAGWWTGDAARQRLRKKYWYWEAAGSEILPATKGSSEVTLELEGQLLSPELDVAFPPEADERVSQGAEWSFTSRIRFAIESGRSVELSSRQSFKPFANSQSDTASGFHRIVEYSGMPAGSRILLDVAPGSKLQLAENNQLAQLSDGSQLEIALRDPSLKLSAKNHATTVSLQADENGNAQVKLEYRTTLPVDRYLQSETPPMVVEQESLHVVPGFDVTKLPLAEEMTPTAFAWKKTGELLFATLKGRVWQAADTNNDGIEDRTTLLADGLSAPFGLATLEEDGLEAIDVADKTALLRMTDTDNDGQLDQVRTVASGWGHSTDYHGWVVGLPRDQQGNYYAVVTNRNGPADQLRGRVMKLEKLKQPTAAHSEYQLKPLVMGLRFPVGIARNRAGELFVTDNQGQFNPYNELNHVVEGSHYGFYNLGGLEDAPEIKAMPTSGPAVGIPHPWVRSVNGICFLETPDEILSRGGKNIFGPFEGHLLGCEATTRQLIRVSLQKVNGRMQGAAYPLSIPPPRGTNSLLRPLTARVAPDGAVLVGSVHDSAWGAGRNVGEIVKMQFHGKLPTGIAEMRAVAEGFELEFTAQVDPSKAAELKNYVLVSYRRVPTPAYGGPDVDRRTEKIQSVTVSQDAKQVTLTLPELRQGFVYELRLRNLTPDGKQFHPAEAFYSLGPLQ